MTEPNPLGDDNDWAMLHYATGILLGIASKYGLVDVTIYHNGIHVRIEQVKEERHDRPP
jgi:hypothetical protein